MKRFRRDWPVTMTMLTATLLWHGGLQTASAQPAPLRADEALAAVGDKSPVGMLYRAYRFEQIGQFAEALWVYQTILDEHGADNRWGQTAALAMARWRLTRPEPAEPGAAGELLDLLPADLEDGHLRRERDLWRLVVDLHQAAEAWLGEDTNRSFNVSVDQAIGQWRVPSKLRSEFIRAMDLLRSRFAASEHAPAGAAFFHHLLGAGTHPLVQRITLRHLADLRLAAGDPQGAADAARAYWLCSVDAPDRLPDAINLVAVVMQTAGADDQSVEAFRYRQMLGEAADRPVNDLLQPVTLRAESQPSLISGKTLAQTESDLMRARLLLFNGQLTAAVPILQEAVQTHRPPSEAYDESLRLIRMALALHDGHMHRIDRYERFLAGGGEADPLAQLVESAPSAMTSTVANEGM